MKKFKALYVKELRSEKTVVATFSAILVLLNLFLLIRVGKMELGSATQISSFPLILIAYGYLGLSYAIISREWSSGTSTLFTSLPVKGEYLLGAKILTVWTQYAVLMALSIAGFTLVSRLEFAAQPEALTYTFATSMHLAIILFITLLPIAPLIFFTYLSGTFFGRWPTAVRIITGVVLYQVIFNGTKIIDLYSNLGSVAIQLPLFSSSSSSDGATSFTVSATTNQLAVPVIYYFVSYLLALLCFRLAARLLDGGKFK